MAYTKYSLTPANNNAAPPNGAPEGMLPSAVNDTMRDMMAQIRDCGDGIRGGTYTMTAPVITGGSISGGSINGTTVGASTASTGAFTTLYASQDFGGLTETYASQIGGIDGSIGFSGIKVAYKDASSLDSAGSFPLQVFTDGTQQMCVTGEGNVGIGTSSPAHKLDVAAISGIGVSSSQPKFVLNDTATLNHISSLFVANGNGLVITTDPYSVVANSYQAFQIDGSEKMRITSSGNVGIGTSSPSTQLETSYSFDGKSDTTAVILGGTDDGFAFTGVKVGYKDTNSLASGGSFPLQVFTNNVQQMSVNGAGNVSFGTPYTTAGAQTSLQVNAADNYIIYSNANTTTNLVRQYFFNPNGTVGSISTNGSSTSYATSSDYRLKENIAPMTGALDTVSQLKPCTYTWKVDGEAGQGFIAHELQAVVPDAVSGSKDGTEDIGNTVDANGNIVSNNVTKPTNLQEGWSWEKTGTKPVYQGVDTSFLVATLTAAIQELKAELDSVKVELATLKA